MIASMSDRLFKIAEVAAVAGLLAMMAHIVVNALSRTMFDQPLVGTLERVQYWYMPVVVLLGFVVAMHRTEHVWADIFFSRFPARSRPFVGGAASIICAAVCFLVTVYSFDVAQHNRAIDLTAGLTDIAAWPTTYLVPLVFLTFGIQFIALASKQLRNNDSDSSGSVYAMEPSLDAPNETEKTR